jgi:hypothetical protein
MTISACSRGSATVWSGAGNCYAAVQRLVVAARYKYVLDEAADAQGKRSLLTILLPEEVAQAPKARCYQSADNCDDCCRLVLTAVAQLVALLCRRLGLTLQPHTMPRG